VLESELLGTKQISFIVCAFLSSTLDVSTRVNQSQLLFVAATLWCACNEC